MTAKLPDNWSSQATCANFLARTILSSLWEVLGNELYTSLLGKSELKDWLNCFPPDDLRMQFPLRRLVDVFFALESVVGERAQRGLLQRSGRVCFFSLHRRSTPPLGILTAQVLTLPKALKVKRCGEILAEYFHRHMKFDFSVEPSKGELKWAYRLPYVETELALGNSLAELWRGFWTELLYTLSGGKSHLIEITTLAGEKQPAWVIHLPYLPYEG